MAQQITYSIVHILTYNFAFCSEIEYIAALHCWEQKNPYLSMVIIFPKLECVAISIKHSKKDINSY